MAPKTTARKTTTSTNTGFPAAISPVVSVPNVAEAVRFYKTLGFETFMALPGPDVDTAYAILQYQDVQLHVGGLEAPPGAPDTKRMKAVRKGPRGLGVNFYTRVDDVNAIHKLAVKAGLEVLQAPREEFWGDRVCTVVDPYGFEWSFGQHVRDVPPDEMAEAAAKAAANN